MSCGGFSFCISEVELYNSYDKLPAGHRRYNVLGKLGTVGLLKKFPASRIIASYTNDGTISNMEVDCDW